MSELSRERSSVKSRRSWKPQPVVFPAAAFPQVSPMFPLLVCVYPVFETLRLSLFDKSGRQFVGAKVLIDCSADADMADEGEDGMLPTRPNRPWTELPEKFDYKAYTQAFDEVIAAPELCERLRISTGLLSMSLAELRRWGVVCYRLMEREPAWVAGLMRATVAGSTLHVFLASGSAVARARASPRHTTATLGTPMTCSFRPRGRWSGCLDGIRLAGRSATARSAARGERDRGARLVPFLGTRRRDRRPALGHQGRKVEVRIAGEHFASGGRAGRPHRLGQGEEADGAAGRGPAELHREDIDQEDAQHEAGGRDADDRDARREVVGPLVVAERRDDPDQDEAQAAVAVQDLPDRAPLVLAVAARDAYHVLGPPEVVEAEREKRAAYAADRERLLAALDRVREAEPT